MKIGLSPDLGAEILCLKEELGENLKNENPMMAEWAPGRRAPRSILATGSLAGKRVFLWPVWLARLLATRVPEKVRRGWWS